MTEKSYKCKIGLLVFTDEETFCHKINDTCCYWEMNNFPLKIPWIKSDLHQFCMFSLYYPTCKVRLYLAIKGIVRGYFLIESFLDMKGYWFWEIEDDSWHPIENGEKKKGHQGFEYYLHDEEDSND